MTAPIFVDTNILVYAKDLGAGEKQVRAAEWMALAWQTERGRLSIQVLQEFYVTLTRKLRPGLTPDEARVEVRALLPWQPIEIGPGLLESGWALQDRFQLSWWDALIVAAAHATRCRYLLTEDLQDGQDLDGLLVVNPFRHLPVSLPT
jgi:predicted nucleic acid-binding protein